MEKSALDGTSTWKKGGVSWNVDVEVDAETNVGKDIKRPRRH